MARITDIAKNGIGNTRRTAGEFREFLSQNVVGIATGFVLGAATTGVVKSLVDDIIMPLISPLGGWKGATWTIGNAVLGWGNFLSQLLNFLLIAFVVFFIVKKLMKK